MYISTFKGVSGAHWIYNFLRDPIATLQRAESLGPLTVIGPILPLKSRRRKFVIALGAEYNEAVLGNPTVFRSTGQVGRGPKDSSMRRVRNGLTAMNGLKHKQQRSLIAPFFSKKMIEHFGGMIASMVDGLITSWPRESSVDIVELMHQMMLRLSAGTLFARESTARLDQLGGMIHEMMQRNLSPWVQFFPLRIPGSPFHRLLQHTDKLEQLLHQMIDDRRHRHTPMHADLLDHLIHARDADQGLMTDADLIGQATIMFGASYETQSKVMSWVLLLLAQHPRVQKKLISEIDEVLGDNQPGVADLDRLVYTEAVLNESMRVLPPVPHTLRRPRVPFDLGSIQLERDDWVVLSHYITHRDAKLYHLPDRFLPERWFAISPTQYEFLPFSAGPRWCLGKQLAMTMMKTSLAMILQRFRLQLAANQRIDRDVRVTMSAKKGIRMLLMPRSHIVRSVPMTGTIARMIDWNDQEVWFPMSKPVRSKNAA